MNIAWPTVYDEIFTGSTGHTDQGYSHVASVTNLTHSTVLMIIRYHRLSHRLSKQVVYVLLLKFDFVKYIFHSYTLQHMNPPCKTSEHSGSLFQEPPF